MFSFQTARLRLVPLAPDDEALYCRLYTDEVTMRFIGAPLSLERARRSFRRALAASERQPLEQLFLTVVEKTTDRSVGICSLQNIDAQRRRAQAGIILVAAARARGYSRETFAGLISQSFAVLPVDELWVQFVAEHSAVERGLISVGFTRTSEAAPTDGQRRHDIWSIRREGCSAPTVRADEPPV